MVISQASDLKTFNGSHMSTLEKMREVADLLFSQKRYKEAYTIYDELYRQIWSVFGIVQSGLSGSSNDSWAIRSSSFHTLWKQYPDPVVNTLCSRILNNGLPNVLNEFIHVIYGRLQCITLSQQVRNEAVPESVFHEFAVLYTLVHPPVHQQKMTPIFAMATALLDKNNRVKRIRSNYSQRTIEIILIEHARSCTHDKWKGINRLLRDYILNIDGQKSELFRTISSIVGPYSFRFQNNQHHADRNTAYTRFGYFGQYDKYKQQNSSSRRFYPSTASEDAKMEYYGKVIGLMGKVSKEQIRSKYINLVSQYHPDKVQHLGPELRELAESKTKEINAAYEWLKAKYHI
jgi:hypothetical protein